MNNHHFEIDQHVESSLVGDLTLKTVQPILNETRQRVLKKEVNIIDLIGIVNVDSAAMALLIELKRLNQSIQFKNLPKQLENLLKISNAREIM
jgi:ABC-type transporter Mla MlaB component